MRRLTGADIVRLHEKMIGQTGGRAGLRDFGLLESALNRADSAFGGHEQYPALEQKIAVIAEGLVKNHPFVDGNKRVGIAAMLLLCRLNGISLHYTQEELVVFGLGLAAGELKTADVVSWLLEHRR